MFGYVRPNKDELLVKEYEQYKAVYCQLCRVLGRDYGWPCRFFLSYDSTFYAMLALAVTNEGLSPCRERCACNPLKRCRYLEGDGEAYDKAAALTILLAYAKAEDDIADESPLKTLGKRLLRPYLKRKARWARVRYPYLAACTESFMAAQKEAEESGASLDPCAEPTAQLLSKVFADIAGEDPKKAEPLKQFGYYLGRWVYLMDAADDLPEDLRTGSFNPFINRLDLWGKASLTEDERKRADEFCNAALNRTAAQMALPLNLLDLGPFTPILENVVHKGLPELQREILFLHIKEKPRRELKNL